MVVVVCLLLSIVAVVRRGCSCVLCVCCGGCLALLCSCCFFCFGCALLALGVAAFVFLWLVLCHCFLPSRVWLSAAACGYCML